MVASCSLQISPLKVPLSPVSARSCLAPELSSSDWLHWPDLLMQAVWFVFFY